MSELIDEALAVGSLTSRKWENQEFPEDEMLLAMKWASGQVRTYQVCKVILGERRSTTAVYAWLVQRLRAAVIKGLLVTR